MLYKWCRGRLGSYAPDAILKRIESATNEGVQQIWLTSEDVGAYGLDLNTNIAILLKKCLDLLSTISKDTGKRLMLRIG
jgi:threonylcarbamoyladenosine tRNA methylthiotransferase CDKAL1